MKKLLWAVTGFLFWITCACSESEIGYTPIGKEHLGETYETYTLDNVAWMDSVQIVVFNFYPEEVTGLPYVRYSESACAKLAHPKISGAKFEHRDAETRRNNLEK